MVIMHVDANSAYLSWVAAAMIGRNGLVTIMLPELYAGRIFLENIVLRSIHASIEKTTRVNSLF